MKQTMQDFFESIGGKRIALIGMGRSHLPLISLFTKYGAVVTACDRREREALGEIADRAEADGAVLSLGEHYLDGLNVDIALRTPGMRFYCDELNALREKGVVISSEMEIFFEICPCRIIGITGSDGKTTSTTVISEMLKAQGYCVHLGGNIGKPLLPEIESIRPEDIAVVELSSFQLISMRISPQIAVVTNLQPNHLDIHKDMQEYIDAKKNIILYQNQNDKAVLNLDNEITRSFAQECKGRVDLFSRREAVENGAYLSGSTIVYAHNGEKTEVLDIRDIRIPGMHNVENYMAAIAAVEGMVSDEVIREVAKTFAGVAHRMELVRELDGVRYYNDSIASSPTRTIAGLRAFNQKVILIAGGKDKGVPFDDLGPAAVEFCKAVVLNGPTMERIRDAIVSAPGYSQETLPVYLCDSFEAAVEKAHEIAESGDIVTLSPACTSFDRFKNFAERGLYFKKLVGEL